MYFSKSKRSRAYEYVCQVKPGRGPRTLEGVNRTWRDRNLNFFSIENRTIAAMLRKLPQFLPSSFLLSHSQAPTAVKQRKKTELLVFFLILIHQDSCIFLQYDECLITMIQISCHLQATLQIAMVISQR